MSESLQLESSKTTEAQCAPNTHAPDQPKHTVTKHARIGNREFVGGQPRVKFTLGTAHGVTKGDTGYFFPDCSFTFQITDAETGESYALIDDKNMTRVNAQTGAFIHTTGKPSS